MREILAMLEEIRRQNIVLKRMMWCLGGLGVIMLLIQAELIKSIVTYALITLMVMAILLTAPTWSPFVVGLTDRIPWSPGRKKKRNDSAADPV